VARSVAATTGERTFFVALSDLRDARFLGGRVRDTLLPAATLEDADGPNAPPLLTQIADALSDRPALLLLDNFEQIAEEGAEFVGELLARVTAVSCLITSRRRLDLSGEREFALSPLAVPPGPATAISLDELGEFASVRLFRDRAQAVRADFALTSQNAGAVAELCRNVEGIPLAIELAAARVEMLTPRQIVARLAQSLHFLSDAKKDAAAKHRSLWATLDWSYGLLSAELRLFLARLSVFRDGWTAEAAAALEEGVDADEALARLSALRRFSLILAEERGEAMRYRMLETVRQYAAEQLALLGDEEAMLTRGRHRDFFLALASQAEPELRKSDQARWLEVLKTEHENFRAALARTNDGEPAQLSLAYSLHRFWMIHGHLVEGREWLARALTGHEECPPEAADPLVARARNAAGVLACSAGDLDAAQAHLEHCLALFHALGNVAGTASALNNLGLVACDRLDFAAARARYEASIALYRQLDAPVLLAAVLGNLGRILFKQRMYTEARRFLEESLLPETASQDQYNRAITLASLGEAEANEGNLTMAFRRFAECLAIRLELGDMDNFELYWRMATLAGDHGDKLEAARLFGAADAVRSTLSLQLTPGTAMEFQTELSAASSQMEAADFAAAWNEGRSMGPGEIIRLCQAKIP
jgi:predicted ATPase